MKKKEAKRIAYSVACMVIEDSNAYELIEKWAKDAKDVEKLREALTELRDELERHAGRGDEQTNQSANGRHTPPSSLFDEPAAELKAESH